MGEKKTSKKIKKFKNERNHTQPKGKRKTKTKKHRWKETIAVRKALCTPKDENFVKSIKRQRTSPIHPNVFSLGEELALEQI